jgi:hypothetical protein
MAIVKEDILVAVIAHLGKAMDMARKYRQYPDKAKLMAQIGRAMAAADDLD